MSGQRRKAAKRMSHSKHKPSDNAFVSIFDQVQQLQAQKQKDLELKEKNVVYLGRKRSGKSTLKMASISEFRGKGRKHDAKDKIKSTTSIDYDYVNWQFHRILFRISRTTVGHVWEIGGGISMAKLLNSVKHHIPPRTHCTSVVLTRHSLQTMLVVLVLDLDRPKGLVGELAEWLEILRKRTNDVLLKCSSCALLRFVHGGHNCFRECCEQMEQRRSGFLRRYTQRVNKRLGSEAVAELKRYKIVPLPIPVLVIGSKCQRFFSGLRSASGEMPCMARALRSVCHAYGVSLLYTSTDDEESFSLYRNIVKAHLLNKKYKQKRQLQDTSSLSVQCGMDSFAKIGFPKASTGEGGGHDQQHSRRPMMEWRLHAKNVFGEHKVPFS
eukprot:jgi/Bigna1/66114/fgenesh1_pg.1_\